MDSGVRAQVRARFILHRESVHPKQKPKLVIELFSVFGQHILNGKKLAKVAR